MKTTFYILLIFILSTTVACENDILNLTPLDAVSEGAVWDDLDLVNLYVNARYNELPHGFSKWAGGLRFTGITDESYHQHEQPHLRKHTNGGLTSDNLFFFNGFWFDAYEAIRNNTILLEQTETSELDADKISQFRAEARYLRAYFYAELISRYGGVPLIESTFQLEDDFSLERARYEDVVAFIIKELDLAIPDLLDRNKAVGEQFGRLTKGAGLALKARTLLYAASPLNNQQNSTEKWSEVALACEALFERNEYSLSGDYSGLFLNPSDPEVIFFKQFIDEFGEETSNSPEGYYQYTGGHRIDEWRFPNGSGGWVSENPTQNFIDQYETLSGEIPVLGYTGSDDNLQPILNPAATDYDPARPYDNRDPRFAFSVYHDEAIFKGREIEMWNPGKDSRDPSVDFWWNGSVLSYGIRKSLDESWSFESNFGSQQPWIYMRLSEFYLTYAEAQYHLGREDLARDYVNRIRARQGVNMPPIDASGLALLDKIKHERKIELAFEGNRWYDARRWRDAEIDFSQSVIGLEVTKTATAKSYRFYVEETRSYPENHYVWPLPIQEILRSNLEQNPGY